MNLPAWVWPRCGASLIRRLGAAVLLGASLGLAQADPLTLDSRVELPGTSGRLDHLTIDASTHRLYVAALGADLIEVVDLDAMRRAFQLHATGEPQGVALVPGQQRLFVANGGGNVQVFDKEQLAATIKDMPDADNLRLANSGRHLFIGYGSGIAVVDTQTLGIVWRAGLPGHPEAFEISPDGSRVYVNVPTHRSVEVLDATSGAHLASWSIEPLAGNFPMALDAQHQRLFVATRSPAALLVLDARDGHQLHRQELCADADDLFFDARRQRLYAVCGQGELRVLGAGEPVPYPVVQRVQTSAGARTGLLAPELARLFVAAPQRQRPAQILVFRLD